MFSSVGCPALVPILMPGGTCGILAELEPADASNATPPIAALRSIGYEGYLSAEAVPYPDSESAAAQTIQTFRQFVP